MRNLVRSPPAPPFGGRAHRDCDAKGVERAAAKMIRGGGEPKEFGFGNGGRLHGLQIGSRPPFGWPLCE